jgi:hypothetical protein
MGKRPGVYDGGAAVRRTPDRGKIQQVIAVDAVITGNIMAQVPQMSRYLYTHMTAMPGDENTHDPMICRRASARPADFACEEAGRQASGRGRGSTGVSGPVAASSMAPLAATILR